MKIAGYVAELATALIAWVPARLLRPFSKSAPRVVITGWFGSETVGDVAILGQIISELEVAWPKARVLVTSFDPARTRRSLSELDRSSIPVVAAGPAAAWHQARADYLAFGGGPLMESRTMPFWVARAALSRLAGAAVILYGCGVGPIRTRLTAWSVAALAQLAGLILVRDSVSSRLLPQGPNRRGLVVQSFDPAYDYVAARSPARDRRSHGARRRLLLFLRLPSRHYVGSDDGLEAASMVATIAKSLNEVSEQIEVDLIGIAMNTGDPSDDDHRVYDSLRNQLRNPELLQVEAGHHSLGYVLDQLAIADAVLSVRFHGMIFSLAAGAPFVAVDYAVPSGKVSAAAADADALEAVIPILDIEKGDLSGRIVEALSREGVLPRFVGRDHSDLRVQALRRLMTNSRV